MLKQSKILVVEDEALTGMELEKKLVQWGYDVVGIVSSGEDAVEKALELEPDLILMDILLKGYMNGVEAAKIIKKNQEIPIIYLTAYSNMETFQDAKITQPQAYLIKPFDETELKFAIEIAFYCHKCQSNLRESEEHYRILAESAPDLIFVINKDLTVDYVNESSLEYLKLEKAEVLGKSVQDVFSQQFFQPHIKELKKVFGTGQSVRVKNIFQFPEGEVWLDTLLKPLKNKKGEIYAVLGISRDISDDKLDEIGD
ncbi:MULTISPECIES: response regulator [Methanobacterium]|jgi:PAS domain S-box-containing protein|uniref:response regulator n=1 Tax=Methanobacterium TaxID=2160 RepID=UPI00074B1107|nr:MULTISPECIES: response regulator [Methanobacterium]KUK75699.1 MAG: PAS domain S-box [Methanobacterium sp. 42_16]